MKYKIISGIIVIFLSSCTDSAGRKDNDEVKYCEIYLRDTGFELVNIDKEIDYFIKSNKMELDRSKFCFGKKKIGDKYCYLALPRESSTDGDHTDCPVI